MMNITKQSLLAFLVFLGYQIDCNASEALPVANKLTPGIDISLSYQQQNQEHDNAQLGKISLFPYVNAGNWTFGLDIPWQRVEGQYAYNLPLRLSGACQRLATGQTLRVRRERLRDFIVQACDTLGDPSYSDSGLGDVTASLQYGVWLEETLWHLGTSLSYKTDSGDYKTFMSSGTTDVIVDISLAGNFAHFSSQFYLGNNFIVGGALEDFYDDYSHLGISITTPWQYTWQIGAGWEYQNPNGDSNANGLHRWKLLGGVEVSEISRIDLQYVKINGDNGAIESEVSATLVFYF